MCRGSTVQWRQRSPKPELGRESAQGSERVLQRGILYPTLGKQWQLLGRDDFDPTRPALGTSSNLLPAVLAPGPLLCKGTIRSETSKNRAAWGSGGPDGCRSVSDGPDGGRPTRWGRAEPPRYQAGP